MKNLFYDLPEDLLENIYKIYFKKYILDGLSVYDDGPHYLDDGYFYYEALEATTIRLDEMQEFWNLMDYDYDKWIRTDKMYKYDDLYGPGRHLAWPP